MEVRETRDERKQTNKSGEKRKLLITGRRKLEKRARGRGERVKRGEKLSMRRGERLRMTIRGNI